MRKSWVLLWVVLLCAGVIQAQKTFTASNIAPACGDTNVPVPMIMTGGGGGGITSLTFTLGYDAAVLSLSAVPFAPGADLPGGWTINATPGAGSVDITASGPVTANGGTNELIILYFDVAGAVCDGNISALALTNVVSAPIATTAVNSGTCTVTCPTSPAAPPACAANPVPADLAIDMPYNQVLSWDPAPGAASYDVFFGETNPPAFVANVIVASYTPGALKENFPYYWQIVPKNICGDAAGCAVLTFTTIAATVVPACAGNPNPADPSINVPLTPTLSWDAVEGIENYDIYLDTVNPPLAMLGPVTTTSYVPAALTVNTVYYWQVVPTNSQGPATGCGIWSFTTVVCVAPPACAATPAPADAAIDVPFAQLLTWEVIPGATSYDVYFGDINPPAFAANVATEAYDPGPLMESKTYYWQIVPRNACGPAVGCLVWSFTTMVATVAPACAVNPNPADLALDIPVAQILTWPAVEGVASYDVYLDTVNPPVTLAGNVTTNAYAPVLSVSTT